MDNGLINISGIDRVQMTLTKEQAAEVLGVSRPTVDKLIRNDNTFPFFRIGKRVLIGNAALAKWIDQKAVERDTISI